MTKGTHYLLLLVVPMAGYVLGACQVPLATAQVVSQTASPRYQISAWAHAGNPSSPTPKHGYYILDTVTGAVWHSDTNEKPVGVSSKLP